MSTEFDHIIIGGGSMGAATAYHLSKAGERVLVLEQFDFVHEHGAHTGQSRIIRKAYFEHPDYVPLLLRAYENWAELEQITAEKLYYETGIVYFGKKGDELLAGVRFSAKEYNLRLEEPSLSETKAKYPMFSTIPDDWDTLFEPEAGFLLIEKCIVAYLREAQKLGATLKAREKVIDWTDNDGIITVKTTKNTYSAKKIIFTAGAWTNDILKDLKTPLKITRQVLGWVMPKNATNFELGKFPSWFVSDPEQGLYYGMPILPAEIASYPIGLKLGAHHHGEIVQPDSVNRQISEADEADFRFALEKYIPDANGDVQAIKTCLYANSPDEHFIIDFLPDNKNVIFACGFSGHGFKFASVIGEILADLATKGKSDLPIAFLRCR